MTTINELKNAGIPLVGRVFFRSSHGYFSRGAYVAAVIVEENPTVAVCLYTAREGDAEVGQRYEVHFNYELIDTDIAWVNFADELEKVAEDYPQIRSD